MRYKADWFIPHQILALTHYVPEVTPDDFMGIMQQTNLCLDKAEKPFHLIIDNCMTANPQIPTLDMILEAIPRFKQSPVQWIVMALPLISQYSAREMEIQQARTINLKYVDTLAESFAFLDTQDPTLDWAKQDKNFFEGI